MEQFIYIRGTQSLLLFKTLLPWQHIQFKLQCEVRLCETFIIIV